METLNKCPPPNSQARLHDKLLLNTNQSGLCYSQSIQLPLQLPKASWNPVCSRYHSAHLGERLQLRYSNNSEPVWQCTVILSCPVPENDLTSNSLWLHLSRETEGSGTNLGHTSQFIFPFFPQNHVPCQAKMLEVRQDILVVFNHVAVCISRYGGVERLKST